MLAVNVLMRGARDHRVPAVPEPMIGVQIERSADFVAAPIDPVLSGSRIVGFNSYCFCSAVL